MWIMDYVDSPKFLVLLTGPEYVSAREWMRICFELLELLKAHKKAIRRAAVNTFGYIAKAIGPHDVLATLLNNLKVTELDFIY